MSIPRSLARRLRAVLRRSVLEADPRGAWPFLLCRAGPHGLALEAIRGDVGVRLDLPGPRPGHTLTFPASALADVEGRTDAPVTFEDVGDGKAEARWEEAGVPHRLLVET